MSGKYYWTVNEYTHVSAFIIDNIYYLITVDSVYVL